jgi:hypothetical protein
VREFLKFPISPFRFHVTAFTQVGPETKEGGMEDIRGRREQRFHGLGFKLEGEDDEGKGSEKNTHAACTLASFSQISNCLFSGRLSNV